MAAVTPTDLISLIAPGAMVEVRDEEWLVGSTQQTPTDGLLVRCIGASTLVRDTEASFFTNLDRIIPLRPEETQLVQDDSPNFRTGRLYLEAVLRKTPLPATRPALSRLGASPGSRSAAIPARSSLPASSCCSS